MRKVEVPPGAAPVTHSTFDNLQGLAFGVVMVAFGITMLKAMGLITGQAAGLAFLISYGTGADFGLVFFLINIPFYILSALRLPRGFTLRSIACVGAISALASLGPHLIRFEHVEPFAGAIVAGFCIGIGSIGLFRHGASGGGVGILAYYIQERTGFRAGWLQLAIDAALFTAAAFLLDGMAVLVSMVGAAALNLLVAFNHRRDWYIAR